MIFLAHPCTTFVPALWKGHDWHQLRRPCNSICRQGRPRSCKTWLIVLCVKIRSSKQKIPATGLSGSMAVLISDRWKHACSQEGQDRVLCGPQGPCRPGDAKCLHNNANNVYIYIIYIIYYILYYILYIILYIIHYILYIIHYILYIIYYILYIIYYIIILYYIISYIIYHISYIILYWISLNYIILHYIISYYIIWYNIIWYHIILYNIIYSIHVYMYIVYIYIYTCVHMTCMYSICMSYVGVRDVSSFWCSEDMWRCNVFKISKLWFRCITCWKTGDSVLASTRTSNSNLCAGHGEAQPSEWLKFRFSNPTLAGVDCHDSHNCHAHELILVSQHRSQQ